MTQYILDTDHISLFQKGNRQIAARVNAMNPANIAVTVISSEEQLRGWFDAIRQASSGDRLVWAYLGLRQAVEYFNTVRVLDFTQDALSHYLKLRASKLRVGTQDLRIAAIALSLDTVLVTRNHRDFSQVSGLKIEEWT